MVVTGAGFGADAQLMVNGVPLALTSQSDGRLMAVLPADLGDADAAVVTVSAAGMTSNAVVAPVLAAAPGVYSADGSGYGQGYILNGDGTLNSPSNPAAQGSAITVLATGVGKLTMADQYAVTDQPVSVFIDGFYANGISATVMQAPRIVGDVYAISVYIPDSAYLVANNPDLKNFKMPPQVPVMLVVGPVGVGGPFFSAAHSQEGLALSVAQ